MAKRYHEGSYEGADSRRTQEMQDGGMIREDRSSVANMPQMVEYKPWPGGHEGHDGKLNDTISGINERQREDRAGMKKELGVHKW